MSGRVDAGRASQPLQSDHGLRAHHRRAAHRPGDHHARTRARPHQAAGVEDDQAIASSMEIGVHNATLAIFVAVKVLDETEISIPAAVYSIFMFVFASIWGSFVARRSRETVSS